MLCGWVNWGRLYLPIRATESYTLYIQSRLFHIFNAETFIEPTVLYMVCVCFPQVKRNKHKRVKVMSDDDDSDQENTNEHDRDIVANQLFGDEDEDEGPQDHDETSQTSAKEAGDAGDAYGDLDDSEESGTKPFRVLKVTYPRDNLA